MQTASAIRGALAFAVLFVLAARPVRGATFCVGTVPEFEAAMAAARTNNENDTIRVRLGTYVVSSPLDFGVFAGEDGEDDGKSLSIIGGHILFFNSCFRLTQDPSTTILGTSTPGWLLRVAPDHGGSSPATLYRLEGLTFEGWVLASDAQDSSGYQFEIVGNRFRNNDPIALRLHVRGSGQTARLVNNLIAANDASNSIVDVIVLQTTSSLSLVHNTFADNEAPGDEVVQIQCGAPNTPVGIANNIFRGNTGSDLAVDANCALTLERNNLSTLEGSADFGCCNVDVDPDFEDAAGGNYRLKFGSPVADHGSLSPPGGLPGFDLVGNPRVNGTGPDLGAYEVPWVFADGFESGGTAAWDLAVP